MLKIFLVLLCLALSITIVYSKETTYGISFEFDNGMPIFSAMATLILTVLFYILVGLLVSCLSAEIKDIKVIESYDTSSEANVNREVYYDLELEDDYIVEYIHEYYSLFRLTSDVKEEVSIKVLGKTSFNSLSVVDKDAIGQLKEPAILLELYDYENLGESIENSVDIEREAVEKKSEKNEKNADVAKLDSEIAKIKSRVTELNDAVAKKDSEIEQLKSDIELKDNMVTVLTNEIEEKDAEINKLKARKTIVISEHAIEYGIAAFIVFWVMILITVNMIVKLRLKVKKELILAASDAKIREGVMLEDNLK